MLKIYRLLNCLNMDVAAGAVVCSVFAEKVLHLQEDTRLLNLCLALSIWLIYTVDRLIDVSKPARIALSRRHLFHKKYRKPLWAAAVLVFITDSIIAVNFLPYHMLVFGLLMASAVLAYLIAVNMFSAGKAGWFQKEPLIALIYTTGVWGSKLWLASRWDMQTLLLVVFPFFLIALMNLLIFSWFETETDHINNQRSLSTLWGSETVGKIIILLFALVLTMNFAIIKTEATPVNLMISITRTVVVGVLFSLFYRSEFFFKDERYRLLGDAVFLIPAIPLLLFY